MAGKLHAVMFRKYIKGRDYYDLLWYLTRGVEPNLTLFENAISQTQTNKISLNEGAWIELLRGKLEAIDFKKIRRDLEPFIIDSNEVALINKKQLSKALFRYEKRDGFV